MAIDKYLRIKQVCDLTGLSRATIYALEKAGKFPTKVALGERAVAWRESEVDAWMEKRKAAVKSGREAKPGRPPVRKQEGAAEIANDFSDWSDADDVPAPPNPGVQPTQPSKKRKIIKVASATTKRRGGGINLVAEFNSSGSGTSKPDN